MIRPVLLAILCAIALGACAATPLTVGEAAREMLRELPSTYTGTVTCEGCPPVSFSLALRADSLYFLRTRYLRADSTAIGLLDELGRWTLAPDSSAVLLRARPGGDVGLGIVDERTLVVPMPGGGPATDTTGRTLQLDARPFTPRLQVRGMYTRDARGARLRDCTSDFVVTVARDGASRALDSAFDAARLPRGASLMVSLIGRIEQRPRMEVATRSEVLVVEQFDGVVAGDTCGFGLLAAEGIIGHTWRLNAIDGAPLTDAERTARAWLTIDEHESAVRGNGSCNRFSGRARLNGRHVSFSEIVSTKMACEQIGLETRFFTALRQTRSWRIVDTQLELLDDAGSVLAVFLRGAAERQ